MNKKLIRLEDIVIAAAAITFYFVSGYSWLAFALLLLVPDVSMVGYAMGNKVGAAFYNAAHTYLIPMLILFAGLIFDAQWPTMIGLIWTAHIGIDRTMGYGLKYETGFKDTHVQRV